MLLAIHLRRTISEIDSATRRTFEIPGRRKPVVVDRIVVLVREFVC